MVTAMSASFACVSCMSASGCPNTGARAPPERLVQRAPREAERCRADGRTEDVERPERDSEPGACLADQRAARHSALVQRSVPSDVRRVQTDPFADASPAVSASTTNAA
jgi:hypothetical protein